MEEDDNEMYKTHFAKYIDADVSAENMEETWQKVRRAIWPLARIDRWSARIDRFGPWSVRTN